MKVSVIACIVACATVAAAIPPPGGKFGPGGFGPGAFGPKAFGPGGFGPGAFGPGSFAGPGAAFMPSADMINAFIPTPEEIAALNALKTTPAPGTPTTTPGAGPTTPPTMPPAVANLVSKYMKAASAFMPPSPPTPII